MDEETHVDLQWNHIEHVCNSDENWILANNSKWYCAVKCEVCSQHEKYIYICEFYTDSVSLIFFNFQIFISKLRSNRRSGFTKQSTYSSKSNEITLHWPW